MSKKQRDLRKVQKIKDHIRDVPTDKLVNRYNSGYLGTAGAVATRELLAERNEDVRAHAPRLIAVDTPSHPAS